MTAHDTPTAPGFSLVRELAVAVGAGVFMALAGAFGTADAALGVRLVYWVGLMATGTLLGNLATHVAVRVALFEQRPWLWSVLVALTISPPLLVIVWLVTSLTFHGGLDPRLIPQYVLPVVMISLAMTAITVLTQRTPPMTHAAAGEAKPAVFLERLPAKLRGAELLAVQAEDHYLRLHTSRGQDLILMRLADAVAELEGLEGAQVHRSWWVAKDAVRDVARGSGRATLTLANGVEAPVSRTYSRALRAEGWF